MDSYLKTTGKKHNLGINMIGDEAQLNEPTFSSETNGVLDKMLDDTPKKVHQTREKNFRSTIKI